MTLLDRLTSVSAVQSEVDLQSKRSSSCTYQPQCNSVPIDNILDMSKY